MVHHGNQPVPLLRDFPQATGFSEISTPIGYNAEICLFDCLYKLERKTGPEGRNHGPRKRGVPGGEV